MPLSDVKPPHRVPEFQIVPEFLDDVVETLFCQLSSSTIFINDQDIERGGRSPIASGHLTGEREGLQELHSWLYVRTLAGKGNGLKVVT